MRNFLQLTLENGDVVMFPCDEVVDEPYIRDNGDGTVSFISPHGCEYQIVAASTIPVVAQLLCNTSSPRTEQQLRTDISNGLNVCICVPITLTADLTVTKGISFQKDGIISTNGHVLTITGSLFAEPFQIFNTAANQVVFGTGVAPITYVEWFGAKRDGATSDDTAFSLTCAASPGRTTQLLDGTYKITTAFALTNGQKLLGAGVDKTTIFQSTANTSQVVLNNDNEVAYIKFTGSGNLNILGNEVIFFDPVGSGLIGKRCWIHHNYLDSSVSTSGIGGNNVIDSIIEDNIINFGVQGEHGIYISGGSNSSIIKANEISRSGTPAVTSLRALHIKGVTKCYFEQNIISGTWNAYGITVNDVASSKLKIADNNIVLSDPNAYCISVGQVIQCDDIIIENNYCNGGVYGIYVSSSNTLIQGNKVYNAGARGIECTGASFSIAGLTVQDNDIINCVEGIRLVNVSANYNINQNTVLGGAASAGLGISITSGSTSGAILNNVVTGMLGGNYSFPVVPSILYNFSDYALYRGAATGISAAGTTIADATILSNWFNKVTTVGANTGVKLWNTPVGTCVSIWNTGANNLNVWPPDNSTSLNGGVAGAAAIQATGTRTDWYRITATSWIGTEYTVAVA